MVDQYSGYTIIDDIKINGKLTNGEDLADLGGTLLAYLAWKEDTKDRKLEPLDGLTPEQRFFVAYRAGWCTNERDETSGSERPSIRTRRRSIDKQRDHEHEGISCRVSLQTRAADGAGECLPGVVA